MKNPWVIGILAFFIATTIGHAAANKIWGPVKCRDGWTSASIGNSGACSHHKGVDTTRNAWINFISIILAIIAGNFLSFTGQLREVRLNDIKTIIKSKPKNKDSRPISPYGSKHKHREILLSSGAKADQVELVLQQYADD